MRKIRLNKYLDTMTWRQSNQTWLFFYLFKITDTLKKKFRGERDAIKLLSVSKEWKYIGKVSNASYGDMRHAPMPGEPVKEWGDEEIEKCFEYAREIVYSYFQTLFDKN